MYYYVNIFDYSDGKIKLLKLSKNTYDQIIWFADTMWWFELDLTA